MGEPQNSLKNIFSKVQQQERLTFEDGLELFNSTDILSVGQLAQGIRERRHGRRVFYSVNLHLNHTNICSTRCGFCAFSREAGAADAYALTLDEIEARVHEAVERWNVNEVHIVGGHNPELGFDYYIKMMQRIRRVSSLIHIKAFSATEIEDMARRAGLSVREILTRLKEAGLQSLPGGGAEIFDPEVRKKICPEKITGQTWLEVHRTAHQLGFKTNATMLYGHGEPAEARVAHLLKLRELQDETRGFNAFVPLPFNPGKDKPGTSGYLDLKVLSISRLLLDNIPHIKAHWAATDLKFALAALSFGVDDLGGTNLDERVMREAGGRSQGALGSGELVRCIRDAGYEPSLVNSSY
ncbi:MAG TPA: CofH family radical SAM protein [Candidatus Omnitrophota bacterium]|nr:CofH family radical SAM protein [Candidatus Omnitrophota bacterium]HPS37270.1 CofH family radical SAM protein [Candidatus Omnitrophota bacterium]